MTTRRFAKLLVACMLLGLVVRLGAIAASQPCTISGEGGCFQLTGDSVEYFYTARSLGEGNGFAIDGDATAHHPPAYPVFLAAGYAAGLDTPTRLRVLTTLMGTVVIGMVGLVGRSVAGNRTGALAALLAAVYPGFWINDIALMSEPMFTLAVCLCVLAGMHLWRTRTLRAAVLLGLAGGFAALTRAEGIVIAGISAVCLLAGMHEVAKGTRLKYLAAIAGTGFLVLAPWLAFNAARFDGRPVLTTTAGQSLFLTNRPDTYYGEYIGWKQGYRQLNLWTARGAELDEAELDEVVQREAAVFMDANRGRLPVVMMARFGREWNLYQPFTTARLDALIERRGLWTSWGAMWGYWLLFPFAVTGCVALFRRGVPLSPLLSIAAAATLAAIANFGNTRYRAGAEVTLVVLAAAGLIVGVPAIVRRLRLEVNWVRNRRGRPSTAMAATPA